MKIFRLKIVKCNEYVRWYYHRIGNEIYATSINDNLFREVITGRYYFTDTRKPIEINGNYIQLKDVEIMEVFEGNIVAEVSIERVI